LRKRPPSHHQQDANAITKTKKTTPTNIPTSAPPNTTKSISIHVQKVLCGPFCHYPVFVGRTLSTTGKAAVLQHANFMCGNRILDVSFNKYSGVCEFQNDVVFLWVNGTFPSTGATNTPGSDVRNDFEWVGGVDQEERRYLQMTWFGGSRMRIDSPMIEKLIDIGTRASHGDLPDSSGIVLWYRLYDVAKRSFGPYSCLGRLGYHTHEKESYPVKFIFNLLDSKVLKAAQRDVDGSCLLDDIFKLNEFQ
jgi:hypothetical protein